MSSNRLGRHPIITLVPSLFNNVGLLQAVSAPISASAPRRARFHSRSGFALLQPELACSHQGQELSPTQPPLRSLTEIKTPSIRTPFLKGSGMPNHTSVIDRHRGAKVSRSWPVTRLPLSRHSNSETLASCYCLNIERTHCTFSATMCKAYVAKPELQAL